MYFHAGGTKPRSVVRAHGVLLGINPAIIFTFIPLIIETYFKSNVRTQKQLVFEYVKNLVGKDRPSFKVNPIEKKPDAFSAQSDTFSALKAKCFLANFAIFFSTESEMLLT